MEFNIEKLVGGAQTDQAMAAFREISPPQAGPPLHRHHYQLEILHVIRGRYLFVVDGSEQQAAAGDCLVVPAGAAHTFKNLLDEESELHFELLPAGQSEQFFERLVGGDFDPSHLAEFFVEYDMDLLGPPLD